MLAICGCGLMTMMLGKGMALKRHTHAVGAVQAAEQPERARGAGAQCGGGASSRARAALAALEERGCTMLYRMPQWLYDDDE